MTTLARIGKIDVRRDEDQNVKLNQIVELLVNAGYHRARVKGLPPFDKIIGGMTWCIEVCNFDIDVDLLFHESLTIGQKIALTEKIVKVLPYMKCPYSIEPHQIQGLDTIHIYPVVQWLVSLAIETRAEHYDESRLFALSEFERHYPFCVPKPDPKDPWNLLMRERCKSLSDVLLNVENQLSRLQFEKKEKEERIISTVSNITNLKGQIKDIEDKLQILTGEIQSLKSQLSLKEEKSVVELASLIEATEEAKKEISSFKDSCHKERERMTEEISKLQEELDDPENPISQRLLETQKQENFRLVQARQNTALKTREIESLKRIIDDVPGRPELSQYQKRFVELYGLVNAEHHETLQFYNMYNAVSETRSFMAREVELLNSILDNINETTISTSWLNDYNQELNQIIDGIKQKKNKLENKKNEAEKERVSVLADLSRLQDLQLQYIEALQQFSREISLNESLTVQT